MPLVISVSFSSNSDTYKRRHTKAKNGKKGKEVKKGLALVTCVTEKNATDVVSSRESRVPAYEQR